MYSLGNPSLVSVTCKAFTVTIYVIKPVQVGMVQVENGGTVQSYPKPLRVWDFL